MAVYEIRTAYLSEEWIVTATGQSVTLLVGFPRPIPDDPDKNWYCLFVVRGLEGEAGQVKRQVQVSQALALRDALNAVTAMAEAAKAYPADEASSLDHPGWDKPKIQPS